MLKNKINVVLGFLMLLVTLNFWACGGANKGNDSENIPKKELILGQKIYQKYCQSCHGLDGKMMLGGAANLATSTMNNAEVVNIITNGKKLMIAYKSQLSTEQIEAVAAYVETLRE